MLIAQALQESASGQYPEQGASPRGMRAVPMTYKSPHRNKPLRQIFCGLEIFNFQ